MKINIKRYFLPLAAVLFMVGCHEAVEPEAIDVNYSSFEETNPELYARYMQALREYKAGSHKAVFVTMSVPENGAPTTHRTQHFTAMPDSVDFIVVNPVPSVLCQTLVDEIRKVHEKGTRILFNIDLQTFENDWTQVLKEDPTLSEEDALAYLGGRVGEQIALVDRWGYDGFIFTYTGKAVGSMQDEALAVYTARQEALFAPIRAWHEAHPSHALVFRGFTGAITETQARERRNKIQEEASFFGSMDGATKYVKGDAVAGLIITFINLIGGTAMGMMRQGLPFADAIQQYGLLTIGDGLVSQIPSLVISLSTGILVTKASKEADFGEVLIKQLFGIPKVLYIVGATLIFLGIVTPLNPILFVPFGAMLSLIHI